MLEEPCNWIQHYCAWIQSRFDWSLFTQTILKAIKISPLEFVSKRLESKRLCIGTTGFQEKIRCLGLKPKNVNKLTDRKMNHPTTKWQVCKGHPAFLILVNIFNIYFFSSQKGTRSVKKLCATFRSISVAPALIIAFSSKTSGTPAHRGSPGLLANKKTATVSIGSGKGVMISHTRSFFTRIPHPESRISVIAIPNTFFSSVAVGFSTS